MADTSFGFPDVTPGTFQQFTTLLLERLVISHLPEMAGMVRLHGRWTDPGRAVGKFYYGAKVVEDGGAQVKVEILASLVASRGVVPGQSVVLIGRTVVKLSNYGVEVRLAATDIQLGDQEMAAASAPIPRSRMTLERLRSLPLWRVPFPDKDAISVTLIQSSSAAAQVAGDCMAELVKLGDAVGVFPVRVNMLDPVAIARAIGEASGDVVMIIRGGGDASDFEVFDDARVVMALAEQKAHRVIGLGHTGNATLLDLVCDCTSNTPAQAGAYIRERVQQRQRVLGGVGRNLSQVMERLQSVEKQRDIAESQLTTATELMNRSKGPPHWAVAAAFVTGALLVWFIR